MTIFYPCLFTVLFLIISVQNNNAAAIQAKLKKNHDVIKYDVIPFNRKTWKEIDIIWTDPNHPGYRNHAAILRPDQFIQTHHLSVRHTYIFNLRAFSAPNARVMITAIHPLTRANQYHGTASSKISKPVIGIYSYKTNSVQKFLFKNKKGGITAIHATPSHPFYVYNIKGYLPLNKITSSMKLLDKNNQFISLICPQGKKQDCGKKEQPDKVVTVHNIEVYRSHHYFIGKQNILAHNTCESLRILTTKKSVEFYLKLNIARVGRAIDFTYNTKDFANGLSIPGAEEAMMASIRAYNTALKNIAGKESKALINELKLEIKGGFSYDSYYFNGKDNKRCYVKTAHVNRLCLGSDTVFILVKNTPEYLETGEYLGIAAYGSVHEYGDVKKICTPHDPIPNISLGHDVLIEVFKYKFAIAMESLWTEKSTSEFFEFICSLKRPLW